MRLPPSIVMVALLAGGTLMGVVGALLALPVAAAMRMLVDELRVELPGEIQNAWEDPRARDDRLEREYELRAEGIPAERAAAIAVEIAEGRVDSMKIFSCSTCGQIVFFENVRCIHCGSALAYLPDQANMGAMVPGDGILRSTLPNAKGQRYRLCQNSIDHGVCNWAVPLEDDKALCRGCRLNSLIPDLSHPGALVAWGRIELAKKRLLYTLMQLGLPIDSQQEKRGGLVFSFLESDGQAPSPVLTGHDDGHITLNIAEADNPGRERLREQLGETYRTLLGHFRHEIGHYYWDVLVRDTAERTEFRALFGDPAKDYSAELQRHYRQGPPPDWQSAFVSTYATMHPWEDWAETWAHYLHVVDTLGTARAYGMALRPEPVGLRRTPRDLTFTAKRLDFDDFEDLISAWFPLTFALNSLNRGMGLPDLYPFVLSERATEKLRFVHDVIERARVAT